MPCHCETGWQKYIFFGEDELPELFAEGHIAALEVFSKGSGKR